MIVTIHQIEHLPHLSLFKKFIKADIIVLCDTFQFKKNYFENRNKIRANNKEGWQWVTIPVEKDNHKPINEVKIMNDGKWQHKYMEAIRYAYQKAPHFEDYFPQLYYLITQDKFYHNESIGTLNLEILEWMISCFGINKKIILTSELNLNPELKGTDLLVEICKKVGANTYLSGPSGKDYLELEKFGDIRVIFHEKEEGLSAIDYLFYNGGEKWTSL